MRPGSSSASLQTATSSQTAPSAAPGASPGASPQAGRQVYSNINTQNNWGWCVTCAGGLNNQATISTSLASQPSLNSQSRLFSINGGAYTDALWWNKLGANDEATNFVFDFWLNVGPTTDKAQALEFDTFQFTHGVEYMFGTQCDYGSGTWDVWNVRHWAHTTVPCVPFEPGTWYHIVWTFHRTPDGEQHYDTLAINNTVHQVGVSYPSAPLPQGWTDNVGVQFQMDIGSESASMEEWADEVTLTVW